MPTPESKVKAKIKIVLDAYSGGLYYYMPVPGGYGKTTVDYLGCYRSKFFAIEAKAPGKFPSERQAGVLDDIARAGGKVFWIDGNDGVAELGNWFASVDKALAIAALVRDEMERRKVMPS